MGLPENPPPLSVSVGGGRMSLFLLSHTIGRCPISGHWKGGRKHGTKKGNDVPGIEGGISQRPRVL